MNFLFRKEMGKILIVLISIFLTGCGDESAISETQYIYYEQNATTGSARTYNINNSINRVNVYISMGQSNATGFTTLIFKNKSNVFIPIEKTYDYPQKISFMEYSNRFINKASYDNYGRISTATKIADAYNGDIPLYIIQIARGGVGINTGSREGDNWSPYRVDNDGMSLHPEAIRFIQATIKSLQDKGLEPYIIGLDWSQWEAEKKKLSVHDYYNQYKKFFSTFDTVIPNKDYRLFICKPTTNVLEHKDKLSDAFKLIAIDRNNTIIYDPVELSSNLWVDEDRRIHYNEATHEAFADFILNNIGGI